MPLVLGGERRLIPRTWEDGEEGHLLVWRRRYYWAAAELGREMGEASLDSKKYSIITHL